MKDAVFMRAALKEAALALESGEFPVGCVIADGERILSSGRRERTRDEIPNETDHAEIIALRRLRPEKALSEQRRLTLYTTMEPCLMCFGAVLLSPVHRLVYAYEDIMGGGTRLPREALTPLYRDRHIEIVSALLREESLGLFKAFFADPGVTYWRNSRLSQYTLDI